MTSKRQLDIPDANKIDADLLAALSNRTKYARPSTLTDWPTWMVESRLASLYWARSVNGVGLLNRIVLRSGKTLYRLAQPEKA